MKLLSIEVKGKEHNWSFNFYRDPKIEGSWEKYSEKEVGRT